MPERRDNERQKLPSTSDPNRPDANQETAHFPTSDEPEAEQEVKSTLAFPSANTSELPALTAFEDRFEIVSELGRGGMGIVYLARDRQLNRDLAIKLLLDRYEPTSAIALRFFEEASITAQLQHPGIPPIFDLGKTISGRPYLAMKRIKGQTFSHLLDQRRDPNVDLPKHLATFEQICLTLGYAHAKKVIHRDLKPGNIMVGSFGEVQVMDWGLAKVLQPGQMAEVPAPSSSARNTVGTVIESDRENMLLTQAGSVLGTLCYMPPEQATGQLDLVDFRSDVFSLGAIFCEILTGKTIYTGTKEEIKAKATLGLVEEALQRLDQCCVDPELKAITIRCLAKNPTDRFANAGELARTLAQHRQQTEDRLRQRELELARVEAQAHEQRRRRNIQIALISVLACFISLIVIVAFGIYDIRQEAYKSTERILDRVDNYLNERLYPVASSVLDRVDERLQTHSVPQLSDRAIRYRQELKLAFAFEGLDDLPWRVMDRTTPKAEAIEECKTAFAAGGLNVLTETIAESSSKILQARNPSRIVDMLDVWLWLEPQNATIGNLLLQVDSNPTTSEIRQAWIAADLPRMANSLEKMKTMEVTPHFTSLWVPTSKMPFPLQIQLLRAAWKQYPSNFDVLYSLGRVYHSMKPARYAEAISFYRAALAIRPNVVALLIDLGLAKVRLGQYQEAIEVYERALQINPKLSVTLSNLGSVYLRLHQYDRALQYYEKALELDADSAYAWNNLGVAYWEKGDWQKSLRAYQEAAKRDPKSTWRQEYVQAVERYLRAEPRRIELNRTKAKPDSDEEAFLLGEMSITLGDFQNAFRYFEAVQQTPKKLDLQVRYDLACRIGQALQGQHAGWKNLTAQQQLYLQTQAIAWLEQEFQARMKDPDNPQSSLATIEFWLRDPDLEPFRDLFALTKLPEAQQDSLKRFWRTIENYVTRKTP